MLLTCLVCERLKERWGLFSAVFSWQFHCKSKKLCLSEKKKKKKWECERVDVRLEESEAETSLGVAADEAKEEYYSLVIEFKKEFVLASLTVMEL